MLHRRPTNPNLQINSSGPALQPSASTSTPIQNKAYHPLRRQSSNLYATPASGSKARYSLPSPSLSYAGARQSPVYPIPGGTFDYGASGRGGAGLGLGLEGGFDGKETGGAVVGKLRGGLEKIRRGVGDAGKLDKSWSLVWSDRELRTLVLKSTLINLVSLLLLSLSPLIFSPIFVTSPARDVSPTMQTRTREIGLWYNLLLSWPVFVVCFWINATWAPHISRRVQTLLHPSHRHQPLGSSTSTSQGRDGLTSNPAAWIFSSLTRIFLILDFTVVSRLLMLVPLLGRPSALVYMCIINSYYCFESTFNSKQWPLDHRVTYMQERTSYMIGFGLPATVMTAFGPPLVNMAIFALLYPFFVIQAYQSRPPTPQTSLLPSTPSPHSSLPSSPMEGGMNLNSPFFPSTNLTSPSEWRFEPKVPIFFLARYALEGLAWIEVAMGRERGSGRRSLVGRDRPGKRLM